MSPLEQQRFIREELAAFKRQLEPPDASYPAEVEAVLGCVHERLFEPALTVGAALRACGIRGSHIHSDFKWHVGKTLGEHIRDRRLLAAVRLLGHEQLSIDTIAFSIGYEHYSSFRRAFKREMGCPPSVYREQMGGTK